MAKSQKISVKNALICNNLEHAVGPPPPVAALTSSLGRSCALTDHFFEEQEEQSQIKAEIVTKYFLVWANIIVATQKRYKRENQIAYIDLFAGPGRYRDGSLSTPMMILENAIKSPDLCERLVAIFNDKDQAKSDSLRQAIAALPGIEKLKHQPRVWTGEVGDNLVQSFATKRLPPSFLFVDPFGYKGLSLRLVNSVLKDWGCDCVFFFNYNRISMGLSNEDVQTHMEALFGAERAASLRQRFETTDLRPLDRETFIIEEMTNALIEMGGKHVIPFRFRNAAGTRTTHHLFFVSKAFLGYERMRQIMHDQSLKELGVAKFEYNAADARSPSLFGMCRPLEDLEELLLADYAGKTFPFETLYESHSVGKPYVVNNYREVLCRMEQEGKVTMDRHFSQRRPNTLAPTVKITFPGRATK
jgi:three-Cys-motif partner protein